MKITTDEIGINVAWRRKPPASGLAWSFRAFTACCAVLAAIFTWAAITTGWTLALGAGLMAVFAVLGARSERDLREHRRPRPDYALIARMEREVYGEAFHHDGAPEQETVRQRVERQATAREPGAFGTLHQMRRERKAREARGSVALDSGRMQHLARAERREHEDCEVCHEMRSRYR